MAERVLIVIDVQNDYFPGGVWALPGAEAALPNIQRLIAAARQRGESVVFIQHVTPPGGPVFAEGTPGWQLHPGLDQQPGDALFSKTHPSCFQETGLLASLEQQGVQALDLCGFMTQMCCDTTAREAYGRGYPVRLFSDATAARDLTVEGETLPAATVHKVSLGALARFAKVLKTAEG